MSQLNLTKPDHPTGAHIVDRSFEVLRKYLEPWTAMTMEQAGYEILQFLPEDVTPSGPAYTFGGVCIEVAEQIPYYHSSHVKLVELLGYLAESPQACCKSTEGKSIIYSPFPRLPGSMRDNMVEPDEEFITDFVNFYAFAAHLLAQHIFPVDPTLALWTHRSAFEEETTLPLIAKEQWVIAAAQFILHSGQTLFKHITFPQELLSEQDDCWTPGPLFKGKPAFSLKRWRFWCDGYKAVSQDNKDGKGKGQGYSQECKDIARRAAKLMECFDETLTFDAKFVEMIGSKKH